MNLEVTMDDLLRKIGALTVENDLLRQEVARLTQAQGEPESDGKVPDDVLA